MRILRAYPAAEEKLEVLIIAVLSEPFLDASVLDEGSFINERMGVLQVLKYASHRKDALAEGQCAYKEVIVIRALVPSRAPSFSLLRQLDADCRLARPWCHYIEDNGELAINR